jgi:hypothetical protein
MGSPPSPPGHQKRATASGDLVGPATGLLRHRQTKEAAMDRLGLWWSETCSLLPYPER